MARKPHHARSGFARREDFQRIGPLQAVNHRANREIVSLPAAVARDVPPVQGHKFVKFDDRIVVVDPASRLVVAMIPRYRLLP